VQAVDRARGPAQQQELWASRRAIARPIAGARQSAVFSFLYLKINKISKIYVRFQIFQKYTPVALP